MFVGRGKESVYARPEGESKLYTRYNADDNEENVQPKNGATLQNPELVAWHLAPKMLCHRT